jgi:hypothetical protein
MKTLLLATTCLVALVVSTSAQTATATFLDVAGKESLNL